VFGSGRHGKKVRESLSVAVVKDSLSKGPTFFQTLQILTKTKTQITSSFKLSSQFENVICNCFGFWICNVGMFGNDIIFVYISKHPKKHVPK